MMKERFKEAKLYTDQLIVFESHQSQVEFILSANPDGNWTIKRINSHIVSFQ